MDEQVLIAEFRECMAEHGLKTDDEIIPYGRSPTERRHRGEKFHVIGDKPGTKNGWYILHLDEAPAAQFGTWRDPGKKYTWSAKQNKKLTAAEKRVLEKRWAEQRRMRDAEELRIQDEAAARAEEIWEHASAATDNHDYLQKKGVHAYGIRISQMKLVIPVRSVDGRLWSLQFISIGTKDNKRFLTGGRKRGCFATLASQGTSLDVIAICEGYATGASIHEAMGWPVAVAFDGGNLEPVAMALRQKYPNSRLVICADNDCWDPGKGNPGVEHATRAAKAAKAIYKLVQFKVGEGRPTDFNDLHAREGLEAVRLQLKLPDDEPAEEPEPEEYPEGAPLEKKKRGSFPMVIPWVNTNQKQKPIPNIENAKVLLDHCGILARYNVIKKDIDIVIPNEQFLVDTQRNDKITRLVSIAATVGLNRDRFEEFVSFIAGQNTYNPVVEWISSVPWDGRSRLQDFYDSVEGTRDDEPEMYALKTTLLLRWLIQAVAVAFSPFPVSTYGVLVFQGNQHVGKTHWFKKLTPQSLGVAKDGLTLKPDDKDSVLQVVQHWLVELGELDSTFKKSEISSLKAFITNESDIVRPPYARAANAYQRRTVFFGSVNDEEFLADTTGNRRFWVIPVRALNPNHGINMQQLWAEVHGLYEKGEPFYLTGPELEALNRSNRDFELTNPLEEMLRSKYDWEKAAVMRELTASDIALELGFHNPKQGDTRAIARTIKEISGQGAIRRHGQPRMYKIPHPRKGEASTGGLF